MSAPEPADGDARAPGPGASVAPLRRVNPAPPPDPPPPDHTPTLVEPRVTVNKRSRRRELADDASSEAPPWTPRRRERRGRWIACLCLVAFVAAVAGAVVISLPSRSRPAPVASTPLPASRPIAPAPAAQKVPVVAPPAAVRTLWPVHVGPGHTLLTISASAAAGPPTLAIITPGGRVYTAAHPGRVAAFTTQPQFRLTNVAILRPAVGVWHVRSTVAIQLHKQLSAAPLAVKRHRRAVHHAAHRTPAATATPPAPTPAAPVQAPVTPAPEPRVTAPAPRLRPPPCVPGSLGC